jgi:hypothetical protein
LALGGGKRNLVDDDVSCYVECRRDKSDVAARFFSRQGGEPKAISKSIHVAGATGTAAEGKPRTISLVLDFKQGKVCGSVEGVIVVSLV